MNNQFFIQKGSFCFIIPFFTENSYVCKNFFNNLKNLYNSDKTYSSHGEFKKKAKKKFAKLTIKTDYFPEIEPNLQTKFCPKKHLGYSGRFLCKCMSSAVKFHDDISQEKDAVHLFLDSFNVKYIHPNVKCSFKFNTVLYLIHDDNEKAAYLLIEINMEDIDNFNIENPNLLKKYISSEQIIFIKHLFYKNKMKLQIERLSNKREKKNDCSLQEWVIDYIRQLCIALKIDHNKDVPKYIFKHAFDYSFIELKKICDVDENDLNIDFNNIDTDFLEKYSKQTYGLLLSDEGWERTPTQITKTKLQDYWTTRDFVCTFILQKNALLFNLKDTQKGKMYSEFEKKWFINYKESKYQEYVSNSPCITGIDTLAIFPFLKAIYKEIRIDRFFEQNYTVNKKNKEISTEITDVKEKLEALQSILFQSSLNLEEIANMEKCIYKQFGIIDKIEKMKELYKQHTDKMTFIYEDTNNKSIYKLTILTLILGLLSLTLDILLYLVDKCK